MERFNQGNNMENNPNVSFLMGGDMVWITTPNFENSVEKASSIYFKLMGREPVDVFEKNLIKEKLKEWKLISNNNFRISINEDNKILIAPIGKMGHQPTRDLIKRAVESN